MNFADFVDSYITCMLWSSVSEPDDMEDPGACITDEHTASDLAPETMRKVLADCHAFWQANLQTLTEAEHESDGDKAGQAGHDFWLTRAGHGCDFWDGDWSDPHADILTKTSKAFGEQWPYVGDDGLIYL